MPKIKVLDTELEFDIMDADMAQRFETEIDRIKHMENQAGKTLAETIRLNCQVVYDAFDHIFGVGTSDQLFGGVYNYGTAFQAMSQLTEEIKKQQQTALKDIRFYTTGNRVQRRAKKK